MAAGALYTYPDNFRAYKILIAAEYSGAKITLPPFKFGETNQSAEFLKKFPLGKVPAFETQDGKCIYESNAIAYYVSNDQLRGKTPVEGALIQQYVNFADQEILPAVATWVFPTLGLMQFNKQATDKAMEDVKKALTVLNSALLTKTFLVGERVTLADIAVGCNLLMLYKQVMEPSFRAQFGNVNRWFLTIVNQPQFKKILGEVKLCETMAKFDGKKYAELHPKQDEKKEKKPKATKEEKPKQEKPKKEKKEKPKKEEDDEEDDLPKQPKAKDPYAGLPKSSFDMDAFKRVYSNKDTATEAIPYFWEHFNKEDFSIWLAEYMYDDELSRVFMSCNLVSGMFQRLDKLRKTAFASVGIFGVDGDVSISGVWIFRTQTVAFELNEDWAIDSPSYKFTKLDVDNPEHKKLIEEYFLWEGDFGGKKQKFNQGKIFK
ncbi:elongation factor 1-gamma-like [Stylophora pistillata]|uniref:Elongation factor 1-gamma n=1 Tax=Stylophora pistillata TaxID=50429 RepID=A0A2B4RWB5_STYPI|nr:elongation factor 1-gamma-like [Stylophora pistillata]PFX21901.1 Elongation factor 1-gamma [Stylophora pistillata]